MMHQQTVRDLAANVEGTGLPSLVCLGGGP